VLCRCFCLVGVRQSAVLGVVLVRCGGGVWHLCCGGSGGGSMVEGLDL